METAEVISLLMLGLFNCCKNKDKQFSEEICSFDGACRFFFIFIFLCKAASSLFVKPFFFRPATGWQVPAQHSRHRAFYSKQFSQPWRRFQSSFRGEVFLTRVRLRKATAVLFGAETSVTMSSSGMLLFLSALLLHSARDGSAGKVTSRLWRRDQRAGRTTLNEHSYKWIVYSSLRTLCGVWTVLFFIAWIFSLLH